MNDDEQKAREVEAVLDPHAAVRDLLQQAVMPVLEGIQSQGGRIDDAVDAGVERLRQAGYVAQGQLVCGEVRGDGWRDAKLYWHYWFKDRLRERYTAEMAIAIDPRKVRE